MRERLLDEILVVEDEPLIAEDISDTLTEAGYGIAGVAHSASRAIQILKESSPSLALLDIRLDGGTNGLELAHTIDRDYQIPFVFLTSYTDETTLAEVQKLKPYGFIVKPFDDKQLVTSVQLAISRYKEESSLLTSLEKEGSSSFFLKQNGMLIKVDAHDILYVQAFDNYCFIFTGESKYLLSKQLKSVEEKLDPQVFVRPHRSYLVNIRAIDSIKEKHLMIKEVELPLSKSRKKQLLEKVSLL